MADQVPAAATAAPPEGMGGTVVPDGVGAAHVNPPQADGAKLIPAASFDYRAYLASLAAPPAPETPAADAAPAEGSAEAPKPTGDPAPAEEKPKAPAEEPDDVTRRMEALATRERVVNETAKRAAADLDAVKSFSDTRAAFAADPIGTLLKAGLTPDQVGELMVKAIEGLRPPEAKPETPPAESAKPAGPTPEEQAAAAKAVEEYRAKAAPVVAARALEMADAADLVRAAAAEGARLDGMDVYAFAVAECDKRWFKANKEAPTPEQAGELLKTVLTELNGELAKDAALVKRHRKPAPAPKPAAEQPAALTSDVSGTAPAPKVFKNEAEWLAHHQASLSKLPRAQRAGRFSA